MNLSLLQLSGTDLRKLRSLKGVKQSTMARALRITQQAYSKIERSKKIDGDRMRQLLGILNYTSEELCRLSIILAMLSSL